MQLAPQRAHPPPVPPRPSRQVVAEALKKSPRPPCPTRQAPPPPSNQKPWRPETTGRTIVYDSAKVEPKKNGIQDTSKRKEDPENNNSIKENNNMVRVVSDEDSSVKSASESSGSPVSSRSSPGCATVVVIEESAKIEDRDENIQTQDWLEAGVRYTSTKIRLPGEQHPDRKFGDLDFSSILERIAMSSLQGLPPLPRSLSGFNLNGAGLTEASPPPARSSSRTQRTPNSTTSLSSQGSRPSPQGRQLTTLDTQLAILRREMFGLRQLDLSLLSQLWSLNESIQEFRQLLQDQEDRAPSPSPSSDDGDDADDTSYSGGAPPPSQPPPPPRRPAPSAPLHIQQQQQYHHFRPQHMRTSSRSSKMLPSDDSPSSEEYGAV